MDAVWIVPNMDEQHEHVKEQYSMASHFDPFGNVQGFLGGYGIEASCVYRKGCSCEKGAFNPLLVPRSDTQDHSNFVHYINSPDRYLRTVAWHKKVSPERWKSVRNMTLEKQSIAKPWKMNEHR